MPPKCVSICKGLNVNDCESTRRCRYNRGRKRSFCRLNMSGYQMNKDCVTKVRITNRNRENEKAKTVGNNMQKLMNRLKAKRQTNRERLNKFLYQRVRAKWLSTLCSDAGFCITLLPREVRKVAEYFNNFITFQYVKSPIRRIGGNGGNGFIDEIVYERSGYRTSAILKSMRVRFHPDTGNLMYGDALFYEYIVGTFLNDMTDRFPIFVKTYGLLRYNSLNDYSYALNHNEYFSVHLRTRLTAITNIDRENPDLVNLACSNFSAHFNTVLIEHVRESSLTVGANQITYSLENILRYGETIISDPLKLHILKFELPYMLYQIYFTLSSLRQVYTHYDLHTENVLLYKLSGQTYITCNYHTIGGRIISFNTNFMPKLIDYGRCFFHQSANFNSRRFFQQLCQTNECNPLPDDCGFPFGFTSFMDNYSAYHIYGLRKNESHDLRLVKMIRTKMLNWTPDSRARCGILYTELSKVRYGIGINNPAHRQYGTREALPGGYPGTILNVNDMKLGLENVLNTLLPLDNYYINQGYQKVGDLHIYRDMPMNFQRAAPPP